MDDDDLKRAFVALRDRDRARAPDFAHMKTEAERRSRSRSGRNVAIAAAAFAMAAIVLLAFWVGWPGPRATPIARADESLDFLLGAPSATVVSSTAPIEQIGEAW